MSLVMLACHSWRSYVPSMCREPCASDIRVSRGRHEYHELHTSYYRGTCDRHTSDPSSYHSPRVSRVCKSILHTDESHGERWRVPARACECSRVACDLLARVIRGSYEFPEPMASTWENGQILLVSRSQVARHLGVIRALSETCDFFGIWSKLYM